MDAIELKMFPFDKHISETYPGYRPSLSKANLEQSTRLLSKHDTEVPNELTKPELDCFIVPSYGSDPPSSVAVKKKVESNFLKGVGDDSHIIQELINEDSKTTLCYVQLMCHFQQMKVKAFMSKIEDKMKRLKMQHPKKGRKYKHVYNVQLWPIFIASSQGSIQLFNVGW